MSIWRTSICAFLVFLLASGCANHSVQTKISGTQTIATLNAKANNIDAASDERCKAIFTLIEQFMKPGSSPQEIQSVLTDTRWLEQTNVHGIYTVAGWIPVDWKVGHDTPFVLFVLPVVNPSSGRPPSLDYHVYFTLTGGGSRSEESAYDILTGRQSSERNALLKEFALCYPDGTIERVSKSGKHSFLCVKK